jgi:tRNA pseudouridine65 synthase
MRQTYLSQEPRILLQTEGFIAIDKPFGISVHNTEDPVNVLSWLTDTLKASTVPQKALFPVHRLDKETSGVQVLALNEESARSLAQAFEQRAVSKTYVGILRGSLPLDEGVWTAPLSDKAEGRLNPAGQAKNHVPCETRYKVLKRSRYFSMCEFDLITGRQHQIRKHCAIAKHALVGDPRYGDAKYNGRMRDFYQTERMFLHCSRLKVLNHAIESELPLDFQKLFEETT